MTVPDGVYRLLPPEIRSRLPKDGPFPEVFEEIRLRTGRGVAFCQIGKRFWLQESGGLSAEEKTAYRVSAQDMEQLLSACSQSSLYAFEDQMAGGYLTVSGGHRIGVCGTLYTEENRVKGFLSVGSVSLRIAHPVTGCAAPVFPLLFQNGRFCSTLIVSPPGMGKTTILRDLIRLLSDGALGYIGMNVSVSDERGELAACRHGVPQFDLGKNTDVLDGGSKEQNLWMLLRSMNPQVLAMDEIGGERELQLRQKATHLGVRLLASMHGELDELVSTDWKSGGETAFGSNFLHGIFQRFVTLFADPDGHRRARVFDREGRECF